MGEAPINRCAPGGQKGIEALAKVTGHEVIALDPEYGHEVPLELAHINPDTCIGCRKCVAVCPTNAIVGAPKRLHGVISDWCTGCALCVTACPIDCIDMRPAPFEWTHEKALKARRLYREKLQREKKREAERNAKLSAQSAADKKKALLADILSRVKK